MRCKTHVYNSNSDFHTLKITSTVRLIEVTFVVFYRVFLYQPKFVWIFYRCTLPESCQLLRITSKFPRSSQGTFKTLACVASHIRSLYWNCFVSTLGENHSHIETNSYILLAHHGSWAKLGIELTGIDPRNDKIWGCETLTFYFLNWYRRRMCILCVSNCI